MKIFLVYHYFALYRRPILNELFARLGECLTLVASNGSDSSSIVSLNCGSVKEWNWKGVKNYWLFNGRFLFQKGVGSATRGGDIVIALGNIYFLSTWMLLLVAKLRRQKIFLWTHGLYGREKWAILNLRLWFYALADGVLLYGEYAGKILRQHGFPSDKIHVIYNSLDFEEQDRIFKKLNKETLTKERKEKFGNKDYLLGFIGRLTAEKQLDMLIKASSVIREQTGKSVACLLVGDGPVKDDLQVLAKSLNVQVFFTGGLYEEELIAPWLMLLDMVVSPGNIGLTAMHALAYGVPVATHNNFSMQGPEFEAITQNQTGVFFDYGDLKDMADKISRWLVEHEFRGEQTVMACRSVIISKYTAKAQCDRIMTALGI